MAFQDPLHGQPLPSQGKTCNSAAAGQDQGQEERGADVGAVISSSFPFIFMTSNKPPLFCYGGVGPIGGTRMSFVKPYPLAKMSLAKSLAPQSLTNLIKGVAQELQ